MIRQSIGALPISKYAAGSALWHVVWLTLTLFCSYLAIAMTLPVMSVYVTQRLGLGSALGGLAAGAPFLATILTRHPAGRLSDRHGGRYAMLRGLLLYAVASVICLLATIDALSPAFSYSVLITGRLLLGLGESLAVVGMLSWAVGMMGPARSGRVMALMGMGMYGAFAAGGPLGLVLFDAIGFAGLMAVCILLPLCGLVMAWPLTGVMPPAGRRESFRQILGRIWRPGAAVGLQGVGFAALGAFISLYFISHGWPYAGLGLTGFGLGFLAMRLLCGHLPDRIGGSRVAMASFVIEIAGQTLLWQASGPWVALTGALLTGMGCSMIFPAMGVEVVRRVPAHLRGTALGGFAAFQDLAYGATGLVAGLFAQHYGYEVVFLLGALSALLGLGMAWRVHREPTPGAHV